MSARNSQRATTVQQVTQQVSTGMPADTDGGEVLESFDMRIEIRRGKSGPEWRAIAVKTEGAEIEEHKTRWGNQRRFWSEYALLQRRLIRFLGRGIGNPLIG